MSLGVGYSFYFFAVYVVKLDVNVSEIRLNSTTSVSKLNVK